MSARIRRGADGIPDFALPAAYCRRRWQPKEDRMLWLVLAIVLLVIAIAGGVIVHPILFALAILALVMFLMGRGRTVP
jgi:4-amino-4-deoxy-L-arabinose transferase-like glycosyltransferase